MYSAHPKLSPRMVQDYCRVRLAMAFPPLELEALRTYFLAALAEESVPQAKNGKHDLSFLAAATGIEIETLEERRKAISSLLDALVRGQRRRAPQPTNINRSKPAKTKPKARTRKAPEPRPVKRKKSGYAAKPVVEHPDPLFTEYDDPDKFRDALKLQMKRHGDTTWHLCRAMDVAGHMLDRHALRKWCHGESAPTTVDSFAILAAIERRYLLPRGYFKTKLPHKSRAAQGNVVSGVSASERRRLAWHLPDDFSDRSLEEQEKILQWVRSVVISGSTDYRRYQAAAAKQRYAVRFRSAQFPRTTSEQSRKIVEDDEGDPGADVDVELVSAVLVAPPHLEREMAELLSFKTSTLAAFGLQRNGVWGAQTASQKVEHLGLMFGALAASPRSGARGFGAKLQHLCFALLVFPAVWDWYLQWRERRRGFYTKWEVDMLSVVSALVRKETGWMRQSPHLASALKPIPGLVSEQDIVQANQDWDAACDELHKHARNRIKEIQRVARVHRDPFETILPVLEASSPVGEYRKITEEIVRLMPEADRYPLSAAEAVRSFLMLRLGLHLGLRQRNLRELLVCPRGQSPRTERQLEELRRGELRWSDRDRGWEVLIPSVAFKNASSSFFGSKPFRLVLPDLGGLYEMIQTYIERHRSRLLGDATDPETFFVKTVKITSADAAYNQTTFYEAWRLTIQRYGIHNPYTGRGAVEGLLPHGPHNVRDVLATHILKKTGSYEQASYAIQDTPDMVAKHYGRFLPQDKSAIAANILNQVWAE